MIVDDRARGAKPPAAARGGGQRATPRRSVGLWLAVAVLCLASGGIFGAAIRGPGAETTAAAVPPPACCRRQSRPRGSRSIRRRKGRPWSPPATGSAWAKRRCC